MARVKEERVDRVLRKCCFRLMAHFPSARVIVFAPRPNEAGLFISLETDETIAIYMTLGFRALAHIGLFFSAGCSQLLYALTATITSEQTSELPKLHLDWKFVFGRSSSMSVFFFCLGSHISRHSSLLHLSSDIQIGPDVRGVGGRLKHRGGHRPVTAECQGR